MFAGERSFAPAGVIVFLMGIATMIRHCRAADRRAGHGDEALLAAG